MPRKPEKISLTSIAAELNLSVSAVSRVINNRTGVSEQTRREVLKVLRRHHFKVKYPEQRSRRIAVVTEHAFFSNYVTSLLAGTFYYCREANLEVNVIVYEKHNNYPLLSLLRDQQCSGVILPSPIWLRSRIPELAASGLPIMLINSSVDTKYKDVGSIVFDHYNAARQATEYLLSCGHENIACLATLTESFNNKIQLQGYFDAMSAAGKTIPQTWEKTEIANINNHHLQRGDRAFTAIYQKFPEITAFLLPNDDMAAGAIHAAARMGLNIPQDISIVSLCGLYSGEFTNPPLTSISYQIEMAGEQAIAAIDEFLKSNGKIQLPIIMRQAQLVVRNSSGSAPLSK
jgi:DNA-binding LacI/PurR family transcriptional regulator